MTQILSQTNRENYANAETKNLFLQEVLLCLKTVEKLFHPTDSCLPHSIRMKLEAAKQGGVERFCEVGRRVGSAVCHFDYRDACFCSRSLSVFCNNERILKINILVLWSKAKTSPLYFWSKQVVIAIIDPNSNKQSAIFTEINNFL